ncbi:hypothetical protein SAMN05421879_101415 [Ornithinimicrobium cerasi]|uniref:Uncharacterized protein n=1 Tax=Ornithinimicrobium cerasi TaxID=2248773 RepID=A0A285VDE5_9MICO|nr:hypothetical protein SAMN05421879_101415 [Ornithinimicrobium cerasi]
MAERCRFTADLRREEAQDAWCLVTRPVDVVLGVPG